MLIHSLFFLFACWDYDTGARGPRGDKMPLLKHAGISTWHSLTAVTMANICKWRRVPLSLWPCHRDSDTSHWTPSMLEKEENWKRQIKTEKKPRKWPNSARGTGVTLLFMLSLPFFMLSALLWPPFVMYSIGLFFFFCICFAVEERTGLHVRDSLKWKCRLLPTVAKAHLIRG